MRVPILYILIIGLFLGCNTTKRVVKKINTAFELDSAAAAKRVREIVPCITTFIDTGSVKTITEIKYDTTREVRDTTITLPCPDGTTVSTKIHYETIRINKHTFTTNTYYVTRTIEDKGKDIIIRDKQKEIEKRDKKIDFWKVWAIIATLLFLVSVIILLLKKSLRPI